MAHASRVMFGSLVWALCLDCLARFITNGVHSFGFCPWLVLSRYYSHVSGCGDLKFINYGPCFKIMFGGVTWVHEVHGFQHLVSSPLLGEVDGIQHPVP